MGGDCDLGVTGRYDIDEMEGDSGTVGSDFLRYLPVVLSLSCVGFSGNFCSSISVSSTVKLASLTVSTCCSNPLSSPGWRLLP